MTVRTAPAYTLGGSDAAAACGIDPYRSPVMLWAEKMGQIERHETEAMEWGKRLEPLVRDTLTERGFPHVPAPADGFRDDERPWLHGHPDAFTLRRDERAVLEVKTAGHYAGQSWGDGPPIHYQAQCQLYMHLTDTPSALLACLVAGQRLEVHPIERDQNAIETMLVLMADFYDHLRKATPPPPDGTQSSRDAIREIFPGATAGKVYRLTRAEWDDVLELRARREQLAAVKEQVTELENRLKLAMGDADTAISPHDTEVLHWRNVQSKRLDTTALKAARPDVYGEFAAASTTRRFTVL